jgi:hypothetical protein
MLLPAVLIDIVCVIAFAAIGRRSHEEGLQLAGVLGTAWPFLVGTAAGWAAAIAAQRNAPVGAGWKLAPTGVVVWIGTVVVGMLLRVATGAGTALSFIVVATIFLGAVLLGWRAAYMLVSRARSTKEHISRSRG